MRRVMTVIGVALLGTFMGLSAQAQTAPATGPTKVFDVPIDHVGMIVRDID